MRQWGKWHILKKVLWEHKALICYLSCVLESPGDLLKPYQCLRSNTLEDGAWTLVFLKLSLGDLNVLPRLRTMGREVKEYNRR